MKTVRVRHFASPHPLWRKRETRTGIWWEESAYYLWWEFLGANEDYYETCRKKGKGKCAKLYADFGDVYKTDFKTWFMKGERGARLFAEPPMPVDITPLTKADLDSLPQDFERDILVLAVDKNLPIREVMRKVRVAFKQAGNSRRRGQRTLGQSRALYPLATTPNPRTLKKTLEVYALYQNNPEAALWEIGQEENLAPRLTERELELAYVREKNIRGERLELMKKKNGLAVAARRYIRNAESIIKWAGKGKFPIFTTTNVKKLSSTSTDFR